MYSIIFIKYLMLVEFFGAIGRLHTMNFYD
jgi:hypothetical protein